MAKKVIKRKNRYYVKNNQETAKGAFYKKKLYRNEMSRQKQHVVNFTYAEKFLYGRVDKFNVPIVLNRTGQEQLVDYSDSGVTTFKFVAHAFENMMSSFRKDTMIGKVPPDPILNANMVPVKGYESPDSLYEEYFNIFSTTIAKKLKASNKPILNFHQFVTMLQELLYTGESIRRMPFTKSGFIKSRLCPINCSSFVLEIGDFKHSNDVEKFKKFYNSPAWDYYVNACNDYGFMIDANAPWRLVADLESTGMKTTATNLGLGYGDASELFLSKFQRVFASDFAFFSQRLLNLYNHIRDKSYVVPVYCEKSQTTIPKAFFSKNYTLQQLQNEFNERYFLRIYLNLRILEEETSHNMEELQNFANSVFGYINAYGITTSLRVFEEIINETFDYNGSMTYYFKRATEMETGMQESLGSGTSSTSPAPSQPQQINVGGTGGTGGGATGGGGGGY